MTSVADLTKDLEQLEELIAKRLSSPRASVRAYTIRGRVMQFESLTELFRLRDQLRAQLHATKGIRTIPTRGRRTRRIFRGRRLP